PPCCAPRSPDRTPCSAATPPSVCSAPPAAASRAAPPRCRRTSSASASSASRRNPAPEPRPPPTPPTPPNVGALWAPWRPQRTNIASELPVVLQRQERVDRQTAAPLDHRTVARWLPGEGPPAVVLLLVGEVIEMRIEQLRREQARRHRVTRRRQVQRRECVLTGVVLGVEREERRVGDGVGQL